MPGEIVVNITEIDLLKESISKTSGSDIQAVERLVGIYKHGKSLQDAIGEVLNEVKSRLSDVMEETGEMEWSTESGKVYVSKPSVSVRYDTRALDALCESSDELARVLRPHRIVSERAGSMTIR